MKKIKKRDAKLNTKELIVAKRKLSDPTSVVKESHIELEDMFYEQ